MANTAAGCAVITLFFGFVLALGAFIAFIAMSLWNGIVVVLWPAMPTIGFWQMWGLMVLINLLFGGLRAVTTKSK